MTAKPPKAYKNMDFLGSPHARGIRILAEYEEPRQRLHRQRVRDTIVVFGSARAVDREEAHRRHADAVAAFEASATDAHRELLERARRGLRLSDWYEDARELSRRLTAWSAARQGPGVRDYVVTTGGGPGLMEAANRGASEVPDGRSVGLGISLPFEPSLNPYISPHLGFEFHYFFTRKLWFISLMRACVLFPGGFGTLDEMFELLTLVQTGKIKRRIPVLLFGRDYWNRVLDMDAMVEFGTVSPDDLNLVHRVDTVDEAFRWLTEQLELLEPHAHPSMLPETGPG